MLVRKYLKALRQSRHSFPYERPLTNCPHKAPTMKEPPDKPMEISVLQLERRPADLSEQTTTNNGDTTANQRRFYYVPFHKKTLALAIATPLLIRSMRLITVYVGEPKGYASPVPVNKSVCLVAYQESDDEAMTRCMEFAAWFQVLIFIYLEVLFVLGYVVLLMWFGNRAGLKIILP